MAVVVDWERDGDGQWCTAVPWGQYVVRGGPGAWWFELLNRQGILLATGRTWGSPAEAKSEVEQRARSVAD